MPEGNGTGRLERIEKLLESAAERIDKVATMGYLHDGRIADLEIKLDTFTEKLDAMRRDEEEYRKAQRERDKVIDGRIGSLVSAIGELIATMRATSR